MISVRCLKAFGPTSPAHTSSLKLLLLVFGLTFVLPSTVFSQSAKIYWTDYGTTKVQRANPDGSNVEDIVVSGTIQPFEIDIDGTNAKMYWTETVDEKIQRANLDGTGITDIVTGLDTPRALTIDEANGKLYWTDWGTQKIQRANLDGSSVEDLITTGLSTPRGIVLDVLAGKMYWTDSGTQKIQRANLDGSSLEDLITSGLGTTVGIDLDTSAGKMYWVDQASATIHRANLDGSSATTIIGSGLVDPSYLSVDVGAGKIFWTDFGTSWVQSANLDGSSIANVVTAGLIIPTGIALAPSSALPVELTSFEAIVNGRDIRLFWSTASEVNAAGFEVQTRDGASWSVSRYVETLGSPGEGSDYEVLLPGIDPGLHTFRLRQIDVDGTFDYSAEIEVRIELPASHYMTPAYPNPFSNRFTFTVAVEKTQLLTITLYDIQGREISRVYDQDVNGGDAQEIEVVVSGLANGIYIVKIRGDNFVASQRVALVR